MRTGYFQSQDAHDARVGEDKTNGSAFQNVNCYSSTNLVEWKYEGALLSRTASGDLGPNRVVERPKVIYNKSTKKYVLWMHIDSSDYKEAKAGVATGDTVCGTYTYLGASQPLGFQSRDMGLFVDDDNKAYLLTEDVSLPASLLAHSLMPGCSAPTDSASTFSQMTISASSKLPTSGATPSKRPPSSRRTVFTSCLAPRFPVGTPTTTSTAQRPTFQVRGQPGRRLQTLARRRIHHRRTTSCPSGTTSCTWEIDGLARTS